MRSAAIARANYGLAFKPDANTVLWLPGQDDPQSGTIRDRSGNGNNGTISGALWAKQSSGLWALDFDGLDDRVDCGDITSFNSVATYTVEGWFNQDVLNSSDNLWIKEKTAGVDECALHSYSNTLYFYNRNAGDTRAYLESYNNIVSVGSWYHCVTVFNGNGAANADRAKIYINGTERTLGFEGTIPTVTANLAGYNFYVGRSTSGLAGLSALLRAYSRALSSIEITGHYQRERHLFRV